MRFKSLVVALALLACCMQYPVHAQQPEPAKTILDSALHAASVQHKNVFLIFHASWCVWCRRLDSIITSPEVSPLIAKNLVVTHLDVLERGDKKATLENAGAKNILEKLGGKKSGLPFYAFLDSRGEKISDSNVMPGESPNIGFPVSPEEKKAFEEILAKGAPHMTAGERSAIMSRFGKK